MGIFALVVGLFGLIYGVLQHLKGKRILAAPFKTTGELQKNPVSSDPKGLISTEGKVVPPPQHLLSPCTQTPCLAYEVKISRKWEKWETTQDGNKKVNGTATQETLKGGAIFGLDDGSGVVMVDATKGGDFDTFKKNFENQTGDRSMLMFGKLEYPRPVISGDDYTTAWTCEEKVVPLSGHYFALGKLEGANITKPGWRALMLSSKGRDGLLKTTNRNKKIGMFGGGAAALAAIPLMIFAPKADQNAKPGQSAYCQSTLKGAQDSCKDTVRDADGNQYAWTVEKPGTFTLAATPPAGKKYPLDTQLVLKNAAGEELANQTGIPGHRVEAKDLELAAGEYTVTVRDAFGTTVKGGFDYTLEIQETTPVPPAVAAEGPGAPIVPALAAEPVVPAAGKKVATVKQNKAPAPLKKGKVQPRRHK